MEDGGAYYNPERGIVIASFLLEQTSPRIEAYYGYTPYALASLIGRNADVTVDSDVMDIQDILADPSLPRRFDHELASFDSVEELIASRWSPSGAGCWTCRATTASRAPWERSTSSRPITCASGTCSPSPMMSWQWESTEPHIRRCHRGYTDGGRLLHRSRRNSGLPPARAHLRGAVQPLWIHLR